MVDFEFRGKFKFQFKFQSISIPLQGHSTSSKGLKMKGIYNLSTDNNYVSGDDRKYTNKKLPSQASRINGVTEWELEDENRCHSLLDLETLNISWHGHPQKNHVCYSNELLQLENAIAR